MTVNLRTSHSCIPVTLTLEISVSLSMHAALPFILLYCLMTSGVTAIV